MAVAKGLSVREQACYSVEGPTLQEEVFRVTAGRGFKLQNNTGFFGPVLRRAGLFATAKGYVCPFPGASEARNASALR